MLKIMPRHLFPSVTSGLGVFKSGRQFETGVYFCNAVSLSFRAHLFLISLGCTVAATALIRFSATSTAFRRQKRHVFQPFFLACGLVRGPEAFI